MEAEKGQPKIFFKNRKSFSKTKNLFQKPTLFFKNRKNKMKEQNINQSPPTENVSQSPPSEKISGRKYGPLKTEEKKDILRMIRNEMEENGRKKSKAIKIVAK